jgi:hypothetical protein
MNWLQIEHGTLQRREEEHKLRSLIMQIIFFTSLNIIDRDDVRPARGMGSVTLSHTDLTEGTRTYLGVSGGEGKNKIQLNGISHYYYRSPTTWSSQRNVSLTLTRP